MAPGFLCAQASENAVGLQNDSGDDHLGGALPFVGDVELVVLRDARRHESEGRAAGGNKTVQVEPGQTATLNVALQRVPTAPLPRPLWRLVTGSILIGSGVILGGFGTAALLTNGVCQDGSTNIDTCSPYYSTTAIGGGLLGTGAALALAGTIMLAIPRPTESQ